MSKDPEVLIEAALAGAQSSICRAMREADISRTELALRMGVSRSMVSHMLEGGWNLTMKTYARAIVACGFSATIGYK